MNLRPKTALTEQEVQAGLKLVRMEGLTTEAMTTLTSGAFLVALALLLGASNLQIGLLASLPTLTNIFQLISIWLVRRYNNRRAISVICSIIARLPLVIFCYRFYSVGDLFPFFLLFVRLHCRAKLECMDERSRARGPAGQFFFPPQFKHAGTECDLKS